MFRRLTTTCPKCHYRFQVEADTGGAPVEYRCFCPACYTSLVVPCDEGIPQSGPTGWAVRAYPKIVSTFRRQTAPGSPNPDATPVAV
jgi:hypothetical protein